MLCQSRLAFLNIMIGLCRFEAAVAAAEKARDLDPGNAEVGMILNNVRLVCNQVQLGARRTLGADPLPSRFFSRPVRSNRRPPVAVYRTGLTGNRWKPVEFKSKFKIACVIGSDRYTGRFDRFIGRFDRFIDRFDRFEFKSKFKIACATGLEWFTGRFDRFTK